MYKKVFILFCLSLSLMGCTDNTHRERQLVKFNAWRLTASHTSWSEVLTYALNQSVLTSFNHQQLKRILAQTDDESVLYVRLQVNILKGHTDKMTHARIKFIKKALIDYGISSHRIEIIYLIPAAYAIRTDNNKNKITVVIDQFKLNIPICTVPKTVDMRQDDLEEAYGCANIRNQALMIAEPRDVYRAQLKGNTDSMRQSLAVENYRTDKVKKVQVPSSSNSSTR